jgi:RHS repeat-associated protein
LGEAAAGAASKIVSNAENDGSGLLNHRNRYYNPTWGRFISEGPIGLAGLPPEMKPSYRNLLHHEAEHS